MHPSFFLLLQNGQKTDKIGRQLGRNGHALARARMHKGKLLGMQALPREKRGMLFFKSGVAAAVDGITEQGVTL